MIPPEPPEPPAPTYKVTISNTFSNSYMFRILVSSDGTNWTAVDGGASAINEPAVIDFGFPDGALSDRFRVAYKAYDNTHPDWDDSYYDDSSEATLSYDGNVYSNMFVQEYTQFGMSFTKLSSPQLVVNSRS